MWVLLVSLWYLSGIILFLHLILEDFDKIRISDVFVSFFAGLLGLLVFVFFLDLDYVIYRKKQK